MVQGALVSQNEMQKVKMKIKLKNKKKNKQKYQEVVMLGRELIKKDKIWERNKLLVIWIAWV